MFRWRSARMTAISLCRSDNASAALALWRLCRSASSPFTSTCIALSPASYLRFLPPDSCNPACRETYTAAGQLEDDGAISVSTSHLDSVQAAVVDVQAKVHPPAAALAQVAQHHVLVDERHPRQR